MKRALLLGIDCGQTVTKAGLYDLTGHEVATAGAPTVVHRPHPGWAERDMDEVWRQTAQAVRTLVAGLPPEDEVVAVGVVGHNDGAYPVDAELRPVRPAVLATDERARELAAAMAAKTGPQALALTGQVPFAGAPSAVYSWLRDHEPDSYRRIRWALFCKDWVRLGLTGAVGTDRTEASASFADLHTGDWSSAALALFDLDDLARTLPPQLASAQVAGTVTAEAAALTGVRDGTPVVAGAHDVDGVALGVGAVELGAASLVLGTFSINQVVAATPSLDPRWQARAFLTPGRWLHMSTSPAGAGTLDWALRQLGPWDAAGHPDPAAGVAEALASPVRSDDPFFLPFLSGGPFPVKGGGGGGGWCDVRTHHARRELLRAVVEGVVLTHRVHLDALREEFVLRENVRVGGGGTRSTAWTQLLADGIGAPVEVTDASEAGARGAALLAGIGIGVFDDEADAVAKAVRVVRRQEPRPGAAARMDGRYRRFRTLAAALRDTVPAEGVDLR